MTSRKWINLEDLDVDGDKRDEEGEDMGEYLKTYYSLIG